MTFGPRFIDTVNSHWYIDIVHQLLGHYIEDSAKDGCSKVVQDVTLQDILWPKYISWGLYSFKRTAAPFSPDIFL
jgi:hypothetical protein